jgi:hypothetical protein
MRVQAFRAETVAHVVRRVSVQLRTAPPVVCGIKDFLAMHAHDDELRGVNAAPLRSEGLKLRNLSIQFTVFPEELGENSLCIEASEHLGA